MSKTSNSKLGKQSKFSGEHLKNYSLGPATLSQNLSEWSQSLHKFKTLKAGFKYHPIGEQRTQTFRNTMHYRFFKIQQHPSLHFILIDTCRVECRVAILSSLDICTNYFGKERKFEASSFIFLGKNITQPKPNGVWIHSINRVKTAPPP